jgi:hypothetical protein
MAPGSIVLTFDVGEDIAFGLFACRIMLVMDELGLSVWKKLSIGALS